MGLCNFYLMFKSKVKFLPIQTLLILLVGFLVLIGCTSVLYWLKGHSSPQLIGNAYFSVKTNKKIVALTFDDGPSVPFTSHILNTLKEHGVKATFFILGKHGQLYPEIIQRTYQEGHEIGNHSWSHERLIFKTPRFIRDEIERTDQLIRTTGYGGYIPFRAPYGNKFLILPWILKNMDRPHILFDIIPKDWEAPPPDIITQRIMEQLHPGAIILLHDGNGDNVADDRSKTVQALESLIKKAKEQGYQFLTISELLAEGERK